MSDDLRERLGQMTSEELADLVRRHDLTEWRPDVFALAEAILHERGLDPASLGPAPPPKGPSLEEPDHGPALVKVMDLPNAGLVAIAQSLLEESEIPFLITNEGTQSLFGWGQMGTGYNFIVGPPVLMVEPSRLAEARELLEPLTKEGGPAD